MHVQTEGNPLFVGEVVRLLVQAGELVQPGIGGRGTPRQGPGHARSMRIPDGVREAVGSRFHRLSPECRRSLTAASAVGNEFSLSELNALTEDASSDHLREALEAHLVEESPFAEGRYQFAHPVIQETLLEELSLTERVRLHARVAETLEEIYGGDAQCRAAELAYHFALAESELGGEKLAHYSLLAGERAMASYGYEDALGHFERGLTARGVSSGESSAQATDAQAAALLFGLARARAALAGAGRIEEVVNALSRAFDYFEENGDVPMALAVAQCPLPPSARRHVIPLIERALKLAPSESVDEGPASVGLWSPAVPKDARVRDG